MDNTQGPFWVGLFFHVLGDVLTSQAEALPAKPSLPKPLEEGENRFLKAVLQLPYVCAYTSYMHTSNTRTSLKTLILVCARVVPTWS